MKNSTGELNLTVIVSIAIVAIGGILYVLINMQSNTIKRFFGAENKNINNTNSDIVNIDNIGDTDIVYKNGQKEQLRKYLSKNTYSVIKNDENIKNIDGKVDKAISKIGSSSITCINSCSKVESVASKDYYKTSNGYLVNIKDSNGNSYTMSVTNNKDLFGNEKMDVSNVYNNTKSVTEMNKVYNNLSNQESKKDKLYVNYSYDETYVSQANVKLDIRLSNNKNAVNKIYDDNKESLIILNAYSSNGTIVENFNAFYITNGLVVTSWSSVLSAIKNNYVITGVNQNNKSNNILGIVSMEETTDIAILKMENAVGTPVKLGNINVGDEILLLTSNSGFGISGSVGVNMMNTDIQTNNLFVDSDNNGSPLFNSDGKVVGIVTNASGNNPISTSISSNILKKYVKDYSNIPYKAISYYSLSNLTSNFYSISEKEETRVNIQNNKLYNKCKDLLDIELELVKFSTDEKGEKISLRYKNDSNIDNDYVIKSFINNLKDKGYNEKLDSNKKKTYKGEYNITVYYEFDYIIIIIEDK